MAYSCSHFRVTPRWHWSPLSRQLEHTGLASSHPGGRQHQPSLNQVGNGNWRDGGHALIFLLRHVRQPLRERDLCGWLRSAALRRGMLHLGRRLWLGGR